jgi:hypothetical protein
MICMEAGMIDTPEAFGAANRKARRDHLRSLTLETAARELEDLLELLPEFERAARESGRPLPPVPLPGKTLAILLAGKPSGD